VRVSIDVTNVALLIGAAVVIVAILAVRLSYRIGLPGLLVYLALGLLLGEAGAGIRFDDAGLANTLGLIALALILAEGGLTTQWRDIKNSVPVAIALSTIGIAVTVGVVAAAAHWLLGVEWRLALLLGAVLAPTDAAAVFSVLRRLPLPPRLAGVLEAESGFNDAPAVILVVLFSTGSLNQPLTLGATVAFELVVGAVIGIIIGPIGGYTLRRAALPAAGLYPIAALALTMAAYASATLLHASGFMAVYVAALVLGNSGLPHRAATRGFAESIAWLAQIGLFLMLGLLASPADLPREVLPALLIGTVLVLIARPLAVVTSAAPYELMRGLARRWGADGAGRPRTEGRLLRFVRGRRGAHEPDGRRAEEPERAPGRPEPAPSREERAPEPPAGESRPPGREPGRPERAAGPPERAPHRPERSPDRRHRLTRDVDQRPLDRPGEPERRPPRRPPRLPVWARRPERAEPSPVEGARPTPGRWWREQIFVSWAGLRGAVPIVLATVPVTAEIAGSNRLFAQVFVIVVVFTLLQGPTLPALTRWCGVAAPAEAMELDVEAAPLGVIAADLLEVRIPEESKLHGVEIFELRLPRETAITLIVRDERSFVPSPSTVLRAGDELLVIAGQGTREAAERRLRAVSRAGRLAAWLGERGD
jgi:NhaP-type Na+/H+ and K+/H+ antiporter